MAAGETAGARTGDAAGVRTMVLVPVLPSPRRRPSAGPASSSSSAPPVPATTTPMRAPPPGRTDMSRAPADRLREAVALAAAINLDIAQAALLPLSQPRAGTLFGRGKIAELKLVIDARDIELVVIDHAVSPIQQRNLEKAWDCKIVDRSGLILEIFGERARTREGVLQVELAHLTYQKGRLVRSWTHLERQRGGAGFLGGPGERQIELDRRMIGTRITAIRKELAGVVKTRQLHRLGRRRRPYPVLALVGYTNAGKSTLFNRLTGAHVIAEDQLFATLDPTMREIALPSRRRAILSDTVGFIADLPTMLIAAFRATLEEVIEADIILHLRDMSHGQAEAQQGDVDNVLRSLGLDPDSDDSNIIEVWNKIDMIDGDARIELSNAASRARHKPVLLSSISGEGMDELLAVLDERLGRGEDLLTISIPAGEGALIHWLYENTEVLSQQIDDDGRQITYNLRLPRERLARLQARLKAAGIAGIDASRAM